MLPNLKWAKGAAGLVWALAITNLTGLTKSAQAAETVVVRKGPFTASFNVADLKTIAETGKVPPALQSYANTLSAEKRGKILAALKTKVPLNVVAISNLLNTRIGSTILADLATITPRKDAAGVQALRAALVLGAKDPAGLSIISFIESYPSQRLNIDLDRAFEVMGSLNTPFWQTQRFMAAIAPQLTPREIQLNLPFDPSQPGTASVQVLSLNLNDSQRQRTIPVDLYSSAGATAEKPVIIFSHGLGSDRTELRYLAEHLASHGYVIAVVEHIGSNSTQVNTALAGGSLLQPDEFLNRPKDISFTLDELEKLNLSAGPFQGKLATDNVMVIGYSMGGGTALSIAGGELQIASVKQRCQSDLVRLSPGVGLQCIAGGLPENTYQLYDPRIKRAMAMNPISSIIFGETGLSKVQVPTLIVTGSADKTTPALSEQILGFSKLPAPKWLVGFVGGTHLSIKDPAATIDQTTKPNTVLTGGELIGDQAASVRNYIKAISLAMAAQLTADADDYAIFLTSDYAQYASTQAIPIRLVTELPAEAEAVVQTVLQNESP
ncbi:alpha/beta hydrolase [Microcoleus sp. FACHB-68]|uniref:alpha/beta hydrolase n=1 Tax=Microcoleus sp. FACHB-68 TaxID=2692826 RepID=UPI001685A1CC|nr:alpha/beta hydrolase [Microcoleus sp. FACHB-68]MBD1936232.1 alpha/beta hydrolase [Microcoleus sp. FACHB-68]